jgi:hypothetical protein
MTEQLEHASTPTAAAAVDAGTADDRSTSFQPVEGGTEQRSGGMLLIEAYTVLWLILMAWLVFQWRRQAAIGARLDGLEHAIDRAAAKADDKSGRK